MNRLKNRAVAFVAVPALLMFLSARVSAQQNIRTVEIGQLSVTHILFTSDLTYVNIASPNVMRAKVVESSKNMLALQATSEFAFQTTISALETNGDMHTFYIRYNSTPSELLIDTRVGQGSSQGSVNTQIRPEQPQAASQSQASGGTEQQAKPQQRSKNEGNDSGSAAQGGNSRASRQQAQQQRQSTSGVNVTSTETSNFGRGNAPSIEEVMRKGRNLYHITDKCYGMEADCINIYAYSDQLYIVLSLNNKSDIGYDAGDAQFTVETKKVSAKTLQSDKPIWPKSSFGKLACAPNSMTKIGYTIPKLTLQKNEVLKVYIYEKDGTRNLFLTLDAKDVNYAVSPL